MKKLNYSNYRNYLPGEKQDRTKAKETDYLTIHEEGCADDPLAEYAMPMSFEHLVMNNGGLATLSESIKKGKIRFCEVCKPTLEGFEDFKLPPERTPPKTFEEVAAYIRKDHGNVPYFQSLWEGRFGSYRDFDDPMYEDSKLRTHVLSNALCTDSHVGTSFLFLGDKFVGVMHQSYRKSNEVCTFKDASTEKEVFDYMEEFACAEEGTFGPYLGNDVPPAYAYFSGRTLMSGTEVVHDGRAAVVTGTAHYRNYGKDMDTEAIGITYVGEEKQVTVDVNDVVATLHLDWERLAKDRGEA